MAVSTTGPWLELWEHAQDVSNLVLARFHRKDKEGLRGASSASRTATNTTVSKVEIRKKEDLRNLLQLRLQQRFPNLAHIVLVAHAEPPVVTSITAFAVETLSKLPRLASFNISHCMPFDMVSAAQALLLCSQLVSLDLPQSAELPHAALGAIAKLTRLTHLTMYWCKGVDVKGLKQLSSLQRLQRWQLTAVVGITNEALACIAQLKALTSLDLAWTGVDGSTLGQLEAVRGLAELNLAGCHLTTMQGLLHLPALQALCPPYLEPAQLKALYALTTLTRLDIDENDITDECSAILRLPSLAELLVNSITFTGPAAGMAPELTRLQLRGSSDSVPQLLQALPSLLNLSIKNSNNSIDTNALVDAIARETGLTSLEVPAVAPAQHMQRMLAPLKQLASLGVFSSEATGGTCMAACRAMAQLPLLRKLSLWEVPCMQHLAILNQCSQLQELSLWRNPLAADTGLLAALVCKPGMRKLSYQRVFNQSVDHELVAQLAAQFGVELTVQ